jgi:hypothetical protein
MARPTRPLETHAERTRYLETGRSAEVDALARAFVGRFRGRVRAERFGVSGEGRPMWVSRRAATGR